MSLLPNRVFLIKYKTNYLGHTTRELKTNVLGFIKECDAISVSKFLKFDTVTHKIDDFSYLITKKSRLKKPLDLRKLDIIQADPLITRVEFALDNVHLELIDEIRSDSRGITLTSNYNIDLDLDNLYMVDRLNALIKDEPYELSQYLEKNGYEDEDEDI